MDVNVDLQVEEGNAALAELLQVLDAAEESLKRRAGRYRALDRARRAFKALASAARRPMRLAVLGETNSGKTTISNRLSGALALPALPIANTRVPTLMVYADTPYVVAVRADGARLRLSPRDKAIPSELLRLEVGLRSAPLRLFELFDLPGGSNPLLRTDLGAVLDHTIDGAIWATPATQAWRESERLAWMALPLRIRRRGILAITHFDRVAERSDAERLLLRLKAAAGPHFLASCPTGLDGKNLDAPFGDASRPASLSAAVLGMALKFRTERTLRARAIAQNVASMALARLE